MFNQPMKMIQWHRRSMWLKPRMWVVVDPLTCDVSDSVEVGFVTVSDLCVKDDDYLQEKFRLYPQTMLTIAIFYSLPVLQLVLQYQLNIDASGNDDLCYFNFLCTRRWTMSSRTLAIVLSVCSFWLLSIEGEGVKLDDDQCSSSLFRDVACTRFLARYPAINKVNRRRSSFARLSLWFVGIRHSSTLRFVLCHGNWSIHGRSDERMVRRRKSILCSLLFALLVITSARRDRNFNSIRVSCLSLRCWTSSKSIKRVIRIRDGRSTGFVPRGPRGHVVRAGRG